MPAGACIQRRRSGNTVVRIFVPAGSSINPARSKVPSLPSLPYARCAAALGRRRPGYDGTAASHD